MNRIKKIQHDCRKATFLIEKQQFGKISLRERIELKIHLAGCSICRLFKQQTGVITRLVRDVLGNTSSENAVLAQDDKQLMQEKIEQAIEKNNL